MRPARAGFTFIRRGLRVPLTLPSCEDARRRELSPEPDLAGALTFDFQPPGLLSLLMPVAEAGLLFGLLLYS